MNKEHDIDPEPFRERLELLRHNLQDLATTTNEAAEVVELDQTRLGRLSRMDALQAQSMSQEIQRRQQQQLRNIAAALQRIEAGNYGLCLDCD
jgi:DnaK suppressor protein